MIILGENHLRRILDSYFAHYRHSRPHLPLDRNAPFPRDVGLPSRVRRPSVRLLFESPSYVALTAVRSEIEKAFPGGNDTWLAGAEESVILPFKALVPKTT